MAHRFLAAEAALMLLLLPPAFGQTSPQTPPAAPAPAADVFYRADPGHTGYVSTPLPTPLSLLWRHTTQAQPGSTASPLYADGVIYFGSGPAVYAVNAKDGTSLWQWTAGGVVETTPTLTGGFLYVGADDGNVTQIDAKTGTAGWTFKAGGAVRSSPLVSSGVIYFGSADSHFYALEAATGKTRWSAMAGGSITTAPIVYGNQVAFADADNSVSSYTTAGRLLWSQRLPDDPTPAPPIYSDGTIYVAAGPSVFALNARSGAGVWARRLPADVTAPLALGPDGLFAVTGERAVLSLSPARGRTAWSATLAFPGGGPPLLAGATLLVPTERGILHAFNAATGALEWQYVVPASGTATQPKYATTNVNSAPIWADGTLYVLSDDGTLSAFRADAPDTVPPDAGRLSPAPGSTVAGVRVPYGAAVSDIGTGIDPASVSLTVDGQPAPLAQWNAAVGAIYTDTTKDKAGLLDKPIADGPHVLTLTAKDWKGNALSRTWSFIVDGRLNPHVTAPLFPTPGSDGQPTPEPAPGPPVVPPGARPNPGAPPPPPPI